MDPSTSPGFGASGRTPLSAFGYFTSESLDEARLLIGRQFRDHRLDNHRRVAPVKVVQNSVPLDTVSLHYLDYGAAVRIQAEELDLFYLIVVPLSGKVELVSGGQSAVCTVDSIAILPCDASFRMLWGEDCRAIIARISRTTMTECLADQFKGRIRAPLRFAMSVPASTGAGAYLRALILNTAADIDRDPSLVDHAFLRCEIGAMIARCVVGVVPHNYSHLCAISQGRAPSRAVQAVVDYIAAHAAEPLPLDRLVTVAGISGRALQSAFLRQVGTSPVAYVRKIRLTNARNDLLAASTTGATVTDVALKWGFGHFGRFSSYYKDAFGELPSETLRR